MHPGDCDYKRPSPQPSISMQFQHAHNNLIQQCSNIEIDLANATLASSMFNCENKLVQLLRQIEQKVDKLRG